MVIPISSPALLETGIATVEVILKAIFTLAPLIGHLLKVSASAFGGISGHTFDPRIDTERIAIMGSSLGGHVSVSAASRSCLKKWLGPDEQGFTAHVGFYPDCKWLNKHFDSTGPTGAPIIIMSGEKDSWGDGETCQSFCDWLERETTRRSFIEIVSRCSPWIRSRRILEGLCTVCKGAK